MDKTEQNQNKELEIQAKVDKRLKTWYFCWVCSNTIHYMVGVIGVACSSLAAASISNAPWARSFGIASAVCFGILGFVRPRERYNKFFQAWKTLEYANLKYKSGERDEKELQILLKVLDDCQGKMIQFDKASESNDLKTNDN